MDRLWRRFAALLLVVLIMAAPLAALAEDMSDEAATDEEARQSDADADALAMDASIGIDEKLERVFRNFSTMGTCVAVLENGAITYTYCYGTRRNGRLEVTPDTVFQVGSISKMVSAMGLLKLMEQQHIPLDAELGTVFGFAARNPAYPDTPVTLRQLLSHTSGLRNCGDYTAALDGDIRPLQEILGGKRAQYAFMGETEAGTRYEYCNFGGGLVGSLIVKLSGLTVDEYMAQSIFAPLGVTAAYQAALLPADAPVADLYHMPARRLAKELRDGAAAVTTADYQTAYTLTAGKLMISAPDLAKLLIALCDGGVYQDARVMKESTVAEMLTPQGYRGSVICGTGIGLCLNIIADNQVEGRTMYGHGGKANGMLCAAYFDPNDRTGVVMLTNGCNNKSVHNGTGMLGRMVMRVIYQDMLAGAHEAIDPYLVDE